MILDSIHGSDFLVSGLVYDVTSGLRCRGTAYPAEVGLASIRFRINGFR